VTSPRRAYLEALLGTLAAPRDLLVAGLGANARYLPHLPVAVPYLALCDAMGAAIPLGLGMALARPQLRVTALEGDGSLLMNLGTLATVAAARAANLTILLFENRAYESSGGQALPAVSVDWVAAARAAGLPHVGRVEDAGALPGALAGAREAAGPAFLVLATAFDPGEPVPPYSERPDEIRLNFARAFAAQSRSRPAFAEQSARRPSA
jgi:thiamine pyrophosphate-dependent acetolactate synthase large subunit-like protein